VSYQYIAKAIAVIGFVWGAGFAFQASEHLIGCISLFMAWLAPVLLGESDE
jgi:dienelactone hydrolase